MKVTLAFLYYAFFLSAFAGCAPMDAAKTVTVEVSNLENGKESDEVLETLKTMYDKNAKYKRTNVRFDGKELTVEMAPVTDVESFARRISFGTVIQVSGRTVKVVYAKSGAVIKT